MGAPSPGAPSPWLGAWWPQAAGAGPVLDLACGRGRHAVTVARAGGRVVAMDRSAEALRILHDAAGGPDVLPVRTDLEDGHGIPARDAAFGTVLVFRYLHRPLAPEIERVLRPGGLLLYETFTTDQRDLPHGPGNPRFLLEPDELPRLFPRLTVLAHEQTCTAGPRPEHLARLAARRP